jgi:hypothetical protein
MAVAVGDRVRVKLTSGAPLVPQGTVQPQPPTIGVATLVAGVGPTDLVDVAFAGRSIQVEQQHLDALTAVSAINRSVYMDKVVTGTFTDALSSAERPYVSEYTGRVVDLYLVDLLSSVALIKALSNDMYYELPLESVRVLGDR